MEESVKKQLLSLSFVIVVNPQQCWFDRAHNCPYGYPDGKFELRPTSFCHIGGCCKITDLYGEMGLYSEPEDVEVTLSEWLSVNKPIALSKALTDLLTNEELEFDEDEKKLLGATIEMLKEDEDPEIFYAKDLEEEV